MRDAMQAADHASRHRHLPPDLFAGLLAISADAVIAVDDEQRIIFFNEGAERIFGWTADEVGGQFLEVLLPERYRAAHRGHVHGFGAAHGRARLMGERQQISALRRSGEEFAAEASIQRLEVDGGNVYAAVLRDVSVRRRAEEALQRAVQARDDMIGIVSHDLRNPANAVKMLAGALLRGREAEALSPGARAQVEVIRQASEQIDALIEDLLDVTRIAAGRLTVAPEEADPRSLVERAADPIRPLAEAAGVALVIDVPADLPLVLADAGRVLQLLSNVVGNAIKFTPAGGRVTVTATPDGSPNEAVVLFTVADDGPGIPAAQLAHVFDRFYQAPMNAGSRGGGRRGAGLGLPIARGIAEAHGGRLWIEPDGRGTVVRFTLRRATRELPRS